MTGGVGVLGQCGALGGGERDQGPVQGAGAGGRVDQESVDAEEGFVLVQGEERAGGGRGLVR